MEFIRSNHKTAVEYLTELYDDTILKTSKLYNELRE